MCENTQPKNCHNSRFWFEIWRFFRWEKSWMPQKLYSYEKTTHWNIKHKNFFYSIKIMQKKIYSYFTDFMWMKINYKDIETLIHSMKRPENKIIHQESYGWSARKLIEFFVAARHTSMQFGHRKNYSVSKMTHPHIIIFKERNENVNSYFKKFLKMIKH